jgi:hypothetical protein
MRYTQTTHRSSAVLLILLPLAAACGSEQPQIAGAAGSRAQPARAALALRGAPADPTVSSEEQFARRQAAASVENQAAEEQTQHRRAAVLAHRTALATQREVITQMRQARARVTSSERAGIDASIAQLESRIAERSTQLRQLEAAGP